MCLENFFFIFLFFLRVATGYAYMWYGILYMVELYSYISRYVYHVADHEHFHQKSYQFIK